MLCARQAQQVQINEFRAELCQVAEQFHVAGERQAREVDLEQLGVAFAVGWAVEHRVGIVKHILRADGDVVLYLTPVAAATPPLRMRSGDRGERSSGRSGRMKRNTNSR